MRPRVEVEIWSDVVCPWCYIGKRRFEAAVVELGDEIDVDVVFRPFQLDPTASPGKAGPVLDAYAKKFGRPRARPRDHRSRHRGCRRKRARLPPGPCAARQHAAGPPPVVAGGNEGSCSSTMKERLLHAYFMDGLDIGDPEVLAIARPTSASTTTRCWRSSTADDGLAEVRDEMRDRPRSWRSPRSRRSCSTASWMVPGAQDPDTFAQVLRRVVAKRTADV